MNYPLAFNFSIGNAISSDGSAFYWFTVDNVYSVNVTNGSIQSSIGLNLGALGLSTDAVISNMDDSGHVFLVDGVSLYTIDTNSRSITSPVNLQGLNAVSDIIWRPCPRGGVRIAPTAGLITSESGNSAGFQAVLTAAPSANVTIGLTSSDTSEGTVFPASITFTPSNWNFAQNVTISGVDDHVIDGDQPYTIVTSNATSTDPNYSNRFVQDVHVVNAEQPGLTATTIHSSPNPSAAGAGVTFTTSVIANQTTPEGSVQFSDSGSPIGNATLSNGAGSFTTNALPPGTRTITADYPGDGFLLPSSASLSQEVKPATGHPSTTVLTSSINPSAPGAPVTLTARVSSGSGKNKPTGAVRFDDGDTTVGTVTLGGNDHAALVVPFAGGTHTLRATYLGSSSNDPSVSPELVQNVGTIATLTIVSSLEPSTVGASVTFTAHVTGTAGNPDPTGTISFSDGTTLLNSESVIGGTATYTTSSLTAGIHAMTAHYSGDSVYAGESAVVKQNVKLPHKH
jgi:predicted thioesterase